MRIRSAIPTMALFLVLALHSVGCGESGNAKQSGQSRSAAVPQIDGAQSNPAPAGAQLGANDPPSSGNGEVSAEGPKPSDLDVPYVPTPDKVVRRMLDLGQVEPGDYVIDLGSGDGRIVIQAVQRGAYGHGVDLDPERVREARQNAKQAGVSDRVMFLQQDLFETDVSQASVIMMYLFPKVNTKLRPKLLKQLRPGTRVVSHSFDMDPWHPDRKERVEAEGRTRTIYLWTIPADLAGQWQWRVDGKAFTWQVEQEFQQLNTSLTAAEAPLTPNEVELRGRRITFEAEHDGARYLFSGRVTANQIKGTVQVRSGSQRRLLPWTAEKQQ